MSSLASSLSSTARWSSTTASSSAFSSRTISVSRARPSMLPFLRASTTPSVKKVSRVPRGSVTVVWRMPVRDDRPMGGEEQAVTGSNSPGPITIGGG